MFNLVKPDSMVLQEPNVLAYSKDGNTNLVPTTKNIDRVIARGLGISPQVSKNVYGLYSDIWRDLIKKASDENDFKIEEFSLLTYEAPSVNGSVSEPIVFSITDVDISNYIDRLNQFLAKTNAKVYSHDNFVKIVAKVEELDQDTDVLFLIDMNVKRGQYKIYSALRYKNEIIIDSLVSESWNFEDLVIKYDMDKESATVSKLLSAKKDSIINTVHDNSATVFASIREVLDTIKSAKWNVNIDSDTQMVESIDGITDSNNERILISFLNSFNAPYRSIKKMSFLSKSIKYRSANKILFSELLDIISREYEKNNCVSADLISRIQSSLLICDYKTVNKEFSVATSN